jgi:hypothetical protein
MFPANLRSWPDMFTNIMNIVLWSEMTVLNAEQTLTHKTRVVCRPVRGWTIYEHSHVIKAGLLTLLWHECDDDDDDAAHDPHGLLCVLTWASVVANCLCCYSTMTNGNTEGMFLLWLPSKYSLSHEIISDFILCKILVGVRNCCQTLAWPEKLITGTRSWYSVRITLFKQSNANVSDTAGTVTLSHLSARNLHPAFVFLY